MLIVRDLKIETGPRVLIDGASFSVQPGDRMGLVGRNGAGKTTLMRTLVGEVEPSEGSITRAGHVGYFSQEAVLPGLEYPNMTALERILAAREIGAMQHRIEETRRKMEAATGSERDAVIRRFARLQDEFDAKGGYVAEAEAKSAYVAQGVFETQWIEHGFMEPETAVAQPVNGPDPVKIEIFSRF